MRAPPCEAFLPDHTDQARQNGQALAVFLTRNPGQRDAGLGEEHSSSILLGFGGVPGGTLDPSLLC
jgi:hypothetical protein